MHIMQFYAKGNLQVDGVVDAMEIFEPARERMATNIDVTQVAVTDRPHPTASLPSSCGTRQTPAVDRARFPRDANNCAAPTIAIAL